MDRFCTLGNIEQSLDRHWTKVGQSLDFDVQSLDLAVQSLDLGVQATIDKEHPNWGCFIKQEFGGVGVVIYDLFEVVYYDLIYGTGLRRE